MRAVCQGTHYPFFEVTSSLFGNLVFLFIPPGLQSLATSFNTRLLLIFSIVSKLQGRGLLMPRRFIPSSQSPCLEGEWVTWWCQNLGSGGKGSEWVPRVQHFQGYPPVESPLDSMEIRKGNQPWIFIGRTDTEAPILKVLAKPPDVKSQLIGKYHDAGKNWGQEKVGHTGWDDWMVSLTQRTRVWASSRTWWWTRKPGVLQSMASQKVAHDLTTEQPPPPLGPHPATYGSESGQLSPFDDPSPSAYRRRQCEGRPWHGQTMCLQSEASWMRDFPITRAAWPGQNDSEALTVINSFLIGGFYIRLFLKFFDQNP